MDVSCGPSNRIKTNRKTISLLGEAKVQTHLRITVNYGWSINVGQIMSMYGLVRNNMRACQKVPGKMELEDRFILKSIQIFMQVSERFEDLSYALILFFCTGINLSFNCVFVNLNHSYLFI